MRSYGLQAMSIGFLIDEETPMIWRGPMVTQALEQLLNDTNWADLDYLVIDLPPGTGDIQLTLAQKVPVSGAVIVTTPQDIALLDARKGLKMFEKVEVPVLGIVENMSIHICSKCGHEEHIFGAGGGAAHGRRSTACRCSARCRWTSASARRPTAASRPWSPSRTADRRDLSRDRPPGRRQAVAAGAQLRGQVPEHRDPEQLSGRCAR